MSKDSKTCIPCNSQSTPLSKTQINELLKKNPEYKLVEIDGVLRISKTYTFKNFKEALAFTNKLAKIAEKEQHHPQIILEWGKVQVSWWTHAIGGLHENDFIMALKTESL